MRRGLNKIKLNNSTCQFFPKTNKKSKSNISICPFFPKTNKGQVTIFIILAIVIVAAVVIFFTATKAGKNIIEPIIGGGDVDIESTFESCIEDNDEIDEKISLIMRQGGVYEPEFYYDYNSTEKLTYLCYTGNYFEKCVMQSPMLVTTAGLEIENRIKGDVEECFDDLVSELERKRYDVDVGDFEFSVELAPENVLIKVPTTLSAEKENKKSTFDGIEIRKKSRAYELAMIAISILNFETTTGSSDISNYMLHYPELKVIKDERGDGTTLYFVSYRESNDKIYFASRSIVYPTGYSIA